jgi:hypothetical protein
MTRTAKTRTTLTSRRPCPGWIIALGAVALLLGLAGRASAQLGVGGSGGSSGLGSLSSSDFVIRPESQPGVALRDFDLQRFFNVANCECDVPVTVFFTLSPTGFAKRGIVSTGTVEFWVGYLCDQPLVRRCTSLGSTSLTSFMSNGGVRVTTSAQVVSLNQGQPQIGTPDLDGGVTFVDGGTNVNGCAVGTAFDQNFYLLVTSSGTTTYDPVLTLTVRIDLAAPPQPGGLTVQPGNEGLVVNWTPIDVSLLDDFLGYQVLCDRAGELQVFSNGTFPSSISTCPTAPLPPPPDSNVKGLDPNFLCSPLLTASTSSFRIKILQNDIIYGVGLAAIDTHHNGSTPQIVYQAPTKTLSFYDKYRNGDNGLEPGRASGGLCAVAPLGEGAAPGPAGWAAAGAMLAAAALRRRPRRRP